MGNPKIRVGEGPLRRIPPKPDSDLAEVLEGKHRTDALARVTIDLHNIRQEMSDHQTRFINQPDLLPRTEHHPIGALPTYLNRHRALAKAKVISRIVLQHPWPLLPSKINIRSNPSSHTGKLGIRHDEAGDRTVARETYAAGWTSPPSIK